MNDLLYRLFRIHPGEGTKVFHFAVLGVLLEAGVAVGVSTADTLFLVQVGSAKLPLVYLLFPLTMVLVTPLVSFCLLRLGIDRLFEIVVGLLALGGLAFFLAPTLIGPESLAQASWFFYGSKIYATVCAILLFSLFWNYVDDYFDILDAKRLFAFFSGGCAVGAVFGGLLVTLAVRVIPVENLFLIWSAIAFITLPWLLFLKRRWRKIEGEGNLEPQGLIAQTLQVARTVKRSRFALLLNLVLFVSVFLGTLVEYQYLGILEATESKESLASIFGLLFALTNSFNLIVNFFLFNRLVIFLGVRNTAILQPIAYLLAFIALFLDYSWAAAVAGFFVYQGLQNSIENNNWNLLVNALPTEAKGPIRTLAEGISEPLAASLVGGLLICFAPVLDHSRISALGAGASLLLVVTAVALRRDYLSAMVKNLKKEWLDFSRSDSEILSTLDAAELQSLYAQSLNPDTQTAAAAVRLLWLNDRPVALEALLALLARTAERDRAVLRPLVQEIVLQSDTELLAWLVQNLEQRGLLSGATLIEILGAHGLIQSGSLAGLLSSSDPSEQAAAAVALWNSWNLEDGVKAMAVIQDLLQRSEKERLSAVRALGQLGQERYVHFLVNYLGDPSDEVRQETLIALRRLASRESTRLVTPIIDVVARGTVQERSVAIEVLSRIGDSRCILPLLKLDHRLTPLERRKVETLILTVGLRSVPVLTGILKDAAFEYPSRSIAARALTKLAFPQFESMLPRLIRTELERAYRYLYNHQILESESRQTPGVVVLSRYYRDVQSLVIEFVLEILTIGGRLPDFELISSSLRSKNSKMRGNAIETIEQACSRDVFRLLLPLVDSRDLGSITRFYKDQFDQPDLTTDEIIATGLLSSSSLECSAAAQALWETAPERALEAFRVQLRQISLPLFRETVLALLQKGHKGVGLNTMERIYQLSKALFFGRFGTEELAAFASSARELVLAPGEAVYRRGDPASTLYVVLEGSVRLEEGEPTCKSAGEVFGEDGLFRSELRKGNAVSESATLLALDSEMIMGAANRYPRIAMGLLENQLLRS